MLHFDRVILFGICAALLGGCSANAFTRAEAKVSRTGQIMDGAPIVISHRGVPPQAADHSFEGYDLAIEQGTCWLELDINTTCDGYLLVSHDTALDLDGEMAQEIRDLALEEIKAYTRPCGEPFYELEEVFARYGGQVRYLLDLKDLGEGNIGVGRLLYLLDQYGLCEQVMVEAFSQDLLGAVYSENQKIPLILLFAADTTLAAMEEALTSVPYTTGVGVEYSALTQEVEHALHQMKQKIFVFFQEETLYQFCSIQNFEVNGIITDYTERSFSILALFHS